MLSLLIIITSIGIGWEDLRKRRVSAYWFLLLLGGVWGEAYRQNSLRISDILINMGILAIHLLLLNLWSVYAKRQWLMQGENLLGWGDILFFGVLVFCFSPLNFMVFYVASLLVILTASLLVLGNGKTVPLAGGQALLFALVVWCEWVWKIPERYSDLYWHHLLNG